MARNPKVIIVDHSQEGRSELHKLLSIAQVAVLGQAGYGVDAHTLVEEVEPDCALVGVEEPVARGLQTIEALYAPDIDASLDSEESKREFWRAFRVLGDWYADLPPY